MKYKKADINFNDITPKSFENLCYDLLVKYDFQKIIWRKGGADSGRDIEAKFTFKNTIENRETNWFFECKHYTSGGVPVNELSSKIDWADAESPNTLVIFVSSYLTNSARVWIEKIKPKKFYEIIIIEEDELKERLMQYSDLIERYFALDRYDKLLKDIKDHKIKFDISPSFSFLKEIITNIDFTKLEIEDITFILFSFYEQFSWFEDRNGYFGDFKQEIVFPVLDFLKMNISNEKIKGFEFYAKDYDELGGLGMFDEMDLIDNEKFEKDMIFYDFQYAPLHLNASKTQENWKLGEYLFIIFEDVAFEIFKADISEIRIFPDFKPEMLKELLIERYHQYNTKLEQYL